jgi:hypothetical protein
LLFQSGMRAVNMFRAPILAAVLLPSAVAFGAPFSKEQGNKEAPDASSLRAGIVSHASGSGTDPEGLSLELQGGIRSVMESDRYGLVVDWATLGELDTQQNVELKVHIRGAVFPSGIHEIDPNSDTGGCDPGFAVGFSIEETSHLSKIGAPETSANRGGYELGAALLCRSKKSRNLLSAGARFLSVGPDSLGSPNQLHETIAEVFLIAERVDQKGRRIAGRVGVDTFSLNQVTEPEPQSQDVLGLISLQASGSIPIYWDEDNSPRVHLGLEGKVFNTPSSTPLTPGDRTTTWETGLVISAGY